MISRKKCLLINLFDVVGDLIFIFWSLQIFFLTIFLQNCIISSKSFTCYGGLNRSATASIWCLVSCLCMTKVLRALRLFALDDTQHIWIRPWTFVKIAWVARRFLGSTPWRSVSFFDILLITVRNYVAEAWSEEVRVRAAISELRSNLV